MMIDIAGPEIRELIAEVLSERGYDCELNYQGYVGGEANTASYQLYIWPKEEEDE